MEPSVTTILPSTLAASISAGVPRPTQTRSAVRSVLALLAASWMMLSSMDAILRRPGLTSQIEPCMASQVSPAGYLISSASPNPYRFSRIIMASDSQSVPAHSSGWRSRR